MIYKGTPQDRGGPVNESTRGAFEGIRAALDAVEAARAERGLLPGVAAELEKMALGLRNAERSLVRQNEKDLAVALASDLKGVREAVERIKKSAPPQLTLWRTL